ncbi:RICIN domain-containing protein [Streptomyces sp. CB01881]|uniref:RICIN domain-containing protein n=1 Tax=Streptomyces sp. CB01881 TaxID=2078691 RepID=UPI000CDC162D|nr:RICIN domain-containing protein [Streptomyces sp. CB01881]AUY52547.1 galactosylceramidase [Streptomyces sp. CB01881]TYC70263.1 galactosylceramidase [Streptomyces sp. CB01881]
MRRLARPLRRAAAGAAGLGLALASAILPSSAAPAAAATATATQAVTIDGTSAGRTFDGMGAISGGGATSRLLVDYPEPQRSQILDYLFKPGYGANLQILKVEIGADANSSDGPEPSHMRSRTDLDCNRGYEWWLMEQAKQRNPSITFYGLEWAGPGWFNGGMWSQDNITYLTSWLGCAKTHGLSVGYLGGWNEIGYDKAWFENLRTALDADGNSATKLVAADTDDPEWKVATDLATDQAFNKAVAVVGAHGVCWHSDPVYTGCPGNSTALALNKPLWQSEDDNDSGGPNPTALARNLNREYIDARITANLKWALVSSWPAHLPYHGAGLMAADQPWSGAYSVDRDIWAMAHTTQFTKPGWKYLDTAGGYLAGTGANGDPHSGSYVTLRSGRDYSTVIETTDATGPATLNLKVTGGLSTGTVHVWATDMASTDPGQWFLHTQDITPKGGAYSLTVQPGYLYTVTTTTGQGKGTAVPPSRTAFPLPYTADLTHATTGSAVPYFHDWAGAFETGPCPAGAGTATCARQVLTTAPIPWHTDMGYTPLTLVGDPKWTSYQAGVDVLLEQSGSAELLGRLDHIDHDHSAYHLKITSDGTWTLFTENTSGAGTTLATGSYPGGGQGTWHNLQLAMQGPAITVSVDHVQVASVTDYSHLGGQLGLGVGGFQNADFANLTVTPLAGPAVNSLVNANSKMCLDVAGASTTEGADIVQWTCAPGKANQQWQLAPVAADTYQVASAGSGMCLDVAGASATEGAGVVQWTCAPGKANQQWRLLPVPGTGADQLVSVNSGMCLDVTGNSQTAGTKVIQWTCGSNKPNQEWTVS